MSIMGVFGINMNEFEGRTPGGWTPPDPGRQTFEITGISEGVNSKGDHAGERYITAKCVQQSGDEPGTKVHSQYLGLSDKPGKYGKPIEQTVGYTYSLDEGMDVGMDLATPVSEEYANGDNAFTGKIIKVTVSQK